MFGVLFVCLFVLCFPVERHHAALQDHVNFVTRRQGNTALPETNMDSRKAREYSFNLNLGLMFRRSGSLGSGQCKVCLASNDCIELNSVRCNYYMDTVDLLPDKTAETVEDSNPQLRAEVDSMLFSIIEKYHENENEFTECIPYVSKYTDCTKETICTGCQTCECDSNGRWNCSNTQQCRPELATPLADQRTLAMVLEKFKEFEPSLSRLKRSLDTIYHGFDDVNMRHFKLGEWIHSEPTLKFDSAEHNALKRKKIEPKITQYEYQYQHKNRRQNLEPSKTINRNKNDTRLLNLIVNTIIEDTLPQVFKENVIDFENNRLKRAIDKDTDVKIEGRNYTYAEIANWMNNVNPYVNELNNTTVETNNANVSEDNLTNMLTSTAENTGMNSANDDSSLFYTNPEFLAFEEVYNNIAVENKNYSRRKPILDHKVLTDIDINMYDDKYYYEEAKDTNTETLANLNVKKLINELGVTVPPELSSVTEDITDYYLQTVTEVVVDLLASAKKNNVNLVNDTAYREINNKIDTLHGNVEDSVSNIIKRDVSSAKEHRNKTNMTLKNNSSSLNLLKEDILNPIGKMINNKQKEMDELLNIRNKLITFINPNEHSNLTSSDKVSDLPLYQVEFLPRHYHEIHDLHKNNVTILETYLEKLKRDVFEIIRDIVSIRRLYKDTSHMPENLKFLIRALKHYIHKQSLTHEKKLNFRRSFEEHSTIKSTIIQILEVLVQKRPRKNALEPLSFYANRLIQRIIEKNYVDEFAASGLRIYDPEYNLTNDLKIVGSKWHMMAEKIEQSSVHDLLYNIKQLHLILSVDIAKMHDALALVNFAKSRRMVPVNGRTVANIMTNINKGIIWMRNILFPTGDESDDPVDITDMTSRAHDTQKLIPRKDSFLSQIKRILKKSKKDLINFIHRKVPKSDNIKKTARKNIEHVDSQQLQDIITMQKWQSNLNIVRKRRSSNLNRLNRRIKDIIPKYLRGKVSPMAIKKSKHKKNKTLGYKKKSSNATTKVTNSTSNFTTKIAPVTSQTTIRPTKVE